MDRNLDQGWAWILLVSTFLSSVISSVLSYNIGIINVSLLDKFEEKVATTAVVGSVFLGAFTMMSPIASVIINVHGCRKTHIVGGLLTFLGFSISYFVKSMEILILTYSILTGTGLCFCNTTSIVVIFFNFKRFLGIAVGVAMAGVGCGLLLSGPLTQHLIDTYDLHGSFLIMSGIALNEILFGLLMRPSKIETNHRLQRNDEKAKRINQNICCTQLFQMDLLRNKSFIVILISSFIWSIPHVNIIFHLPNIAVLQGTSPNNAALLIAVIGSGSTISRFFTGLSVGKNGIDPLLLFMGFCGILGILNFTFPLYYGTYIGQIIFSFVFGIYTGGLFAVRNPLCLDLVGIRHMSSAVGLVCFIEGPGCLIGPPIAGYIIDVTGSYEYSIYLSGIFFLVAFLLGLASSIWRKQKTLDTLSQTEESVFEVLTANE